MPTQDRVYQRIGEFVVLFQWIENRMREIGWFILDPERRTWPPMALRNETTASLFGKIEELFLSALPKCNLGPDLENEYRRSFQENAARFHKLRKARNMILHSAYVELKVGGDVETLMRYDPRVGIDPETGETQFDREILSESSFAGEMREATKVATFFNRCYLQLIQRYPAHAENASVLR